ncbi:MAG TPA: hypothetical protein VL172_06710 [Kofleriaceae bacterium]|nr:hypothetical protein [Kofleriaceae bacterium]
MWRIKVGLTFVGLMNVAAGAAELFGGDFESAAVLALAGVVILLLAAWLHRRY